MYVRAPRRKYCARMQLNCLFARRYYEINNRVLPMPYPVDRFMHQWRFERCPAIKTSRSNKLFQQQYKKERTLSISRIPEKVFLHSASRLYLAALKLSACCSTESLTIFQKQSDTARDKLLVDI